MNKTNEAEDSVEVTAPADGSCSMDEIKTTSKGHLDEDVLCVGCHYNLRGLTCDRICPECGTPVSKTINLMVELLSSRQDLANYLFWVALGAIFLMGWVSLESIYPQDFTDMANHTGPVFILWMIFAAVLSVGLWMSASPKHLRYTNQWFGRGLRWALMMMIGLTVSLALNYKAHDLSWRDNRIVPVVLNEGCLRSVVLILGGVLVLVAMARLAKGQNARRQSIAFLCLLLPWLLIGAMGLARDLFVLSYSLGWSVHRGPLNVINLSIFNIQDLWDYYLFAVVSCGVAALGLLTWFRLMLFRLSRQVVDSHRPKKSPPVINQPAEK